MFLYLQWIVIFLLGRYSGAALPRVVCELNEKHPTQAQVFEYLIPSLRCCLWRWHSLPREDTSLEMGFQSVEPHLTSSLLSLLHARTVASRHPDPAAGCHASSNSKDLPLEP